MQHTHDIVYRDGKSFVYIEFDLIQRYQFSNRGLLTAATTERPSSLLLKIGSPSSVVENPPEFSKIKCHAE